jgi:hypothetical protein
MSIDLASIGLSGIRKVMDLWRAGKSDSLIDYTQVARVEPIVLVDASVLFDEATPDVMQSLLSIFSGYYLQAAALSGSVGRVEVMRHLDRLQPKRSPVDSAADSAGWMLAQESYKFKLPRPTDTGIGLEAITDKLENVLAAEPDESAHTFGRDTTTTLKELANLSVGKQFSVDISDGMHRATFMISIRLISSSLPTEQMVTTLALGSKDTSVKARWHGWRSGRLEFWKDLVLCNDLIDEHRKAMMKDKDGLYSEIVARQRGNALATLFSANPSIATASNMAVISNATADTLEYEIKGKLSDFKTRQRIFEKTSLMILAVIDRDFARVTFYHRGISTKTEVGLRDLKAANKGNGPDVADILRAYQAGHSPSL